MKFDDIKPEDIMKVVNDYLEKFDRYEIKVTNRLISSGKIDLLFNVSEKLASGKYSIHLLKDVLFNIESFDKTIQLITKLQKYSCISEMGLVTHLPYNGIINYLEAVLNISRILPQNYVFLLENIPIYSGNYNYLKQIDYLFYCLSKESVKNIGFCLDLGHLLFGFYKEKVSEEQALLKLESMSYILSNVKQIHIHDYNEKDHLQLKSGIMDLELISKFIKKNDLRVPIIIEATIKKPSKDGISQMKMMSKSLETN